MESKLEVKKKKTRKNSWKDKEVKLSPMVTLGENSTAPKLFVHLMKNLASTLNTQEMVPTKASTLIT